MIICGWILDLIISSNNCRAKKKKSYILFGGQHAGLEFLDVESHILARKFKLAQIGLEFLLDFQLFVYYLVDASAVCLYFVCRTYKAKF